MRLLLVTFVAIDCLFVALALPLIRGLVPPNPFYGFRVPSTLRSRDLWYLVNRRTGWLLLGAGIVDVISALGLFMPLRHRPNTYALANGAVLLVCTVAVAVLSYLYLRRIQQ